METYIDFCEDIGSDGLGGDLCWIARLSGAWVTSNLHAASLAADAVWQRRYEGRVIRMDLSEVEALDSSGAFALWSLALRLGRSEARAESLLQGVRADQALFLSRFRRSAFAALEPPMPLQRKEGLSKRLVGSLRRGFEAVGRDVVEMIGLLGYFMISVVKVQNFRGSVSNTFFNQLRQIGLDAVFIVALISFLLGAVFAQQGIFHTEDYGIDSFVSPMIAVLGFRELGVVLAAVIVSARTTSAFAAEIGTMRMNQEIDAMTVMGISPFRVIALPRLAAILFCTPVLAALANLGLIIGALIVTEVLKGVSISSSLEQVKSIMDVASLWVGILKAPVIGLTIGMVGIMEGFRTGGTTDSISKHTTIAVVKAIFLIVIVDCSFALVFSALGI